MRILHVSGGEVYGGIERMLATLAATPAAGLTQQFAVPAAGRLHRELSDARVSLAALPAPRASRPWSVVNARREFGNLLDAFQPNAALFHGSWTHAMFASVARRQGTGVVFWQHAPIARRHWPDRWALSTPPDVLVANSRFTASDPLFAGVPRHVVHCPVAPPPDLPQSLRKAGREALGAREHDTVVLMAARLEAWKGHTTLIDAASLLGRDDVQVWIAGGVQRAGEQSYMDQLQSSVAAVRPGVRISLLGERADVPALLRLSDVYCQPNLAPEPFGIAIAEAMRSALPAIVSNTGGAAELVDDECGVLTAPGDAHAVAGAIAGLAADPARRKAMGRAACVKAARLTDPAGRLEELGAILERNLPAAFRGKAPATLSGLARIWLF